MSLSRARQPRGAADRYTSRIGYSLKSRGGIMGILWTILLGLIIGVIAKFLHPGKENMGLIMTIGLGIAGSFVAGAVGQFFGWYQAGEGAGFIASVVAAIGLLVIYGKFCQSSTDAS